MLAIEITQAKKKPHETAIFVVMFEFVCFATRFWYLDLPFILWVCWTRGDFYVRIFGTGASCKSESKFYNGKRDVPKVDFFPRHGRAMIQTVTPSPEP